MIDCSQSSFIKWPVGAGLLINSQPQGRILICNKKNFLLLNEERLLWPLPVWVSGGTQALQGSIDLHWGVFIIHSCVLELKLPKSSFGVGNWWRKESSYFSQTSAFFALMFFFLTDNFFFYFRACHLYKRLSYEKKEWLKLKKGPHI